MLSHLRAWGDRLRSSLFFIPMLCVIGGVLLGEAMLEVDALVTGINPRLTATVDSARTVLTTVAGATLTFAGIAFSVSLLLISLASSQYSPRVVHGMFRDPFNKRVMGLVIGTFTYCLVVLRAVRGALEEAGDAIVPSVSILLAVVLGIASILAIVAFINHAAHSMDVSNILRRVTEEVLTQASSAWPEPDSESPPGAEQADHRVCPKVPAPCASPHMAGCRTWTMTRSWRCCRPDRGGGWRRSPGNTPFRTHRSATSSRLQRTWRTSLTRSERP